MTKSVIIEESHGSEYICGKWFRDCIVLRNTLVAWWVECLSELLLMSPIMIDLLSLKISLLSKSYSNMFTIGPIYNWDDELRIFDFDFDRVNFNIVNNKTELCKCICL